LKGFKGAYLSLFLTILVKNQIKYIEPILKLRLGFRARREALRKRSIHKICEYFEPFLNGAMGT